MKKRRKTYKPVDPNMASANTTTNQNPKLMKWAGGLHASLVSAVFIALLMTIGLVAAPAFAVHLPSVPVLDTGGHDQIDVGNGAQDDITATIIAPHGDFSWAWDETSLNGANSLAACTYFQDDVGEVSAVCYSIDITNGVIDEEVTTVFDCDGTGYDFDTLKCAGNSAISTEYKASCELGGDTPEFGVAPYFSDDTDNDLLVNCTITNIDGTEPTELLLLNTCSKPSATESSASKDCIFTEPIAFLQLVKEVTNNTADPAEWTLSASSGGEVVLTGDGITNVTPVPAVDADDQPIFYDLSETSNNLDYDLASLICVTDSTNSTDDISADPKITLMAGTLTVCTFTNELATANLTLVKKVINDNGGDASEGDWTLTADGTDDNDLSGTTGVTGDLTAPDLFVLSESGGPDGYTASSWSCDGGSLSGSDLTLSPGDNVTCTITNDDDAPSLTLVKDVINNNGGTAVAGDWTLTADGYDAANPQAGTYDLSESGPTGYTLTSLTCDNATGQVTSVTLGLGEDVTCTFVNDDDAPSLTLVKEVINNNGGKAVPDDWTLTAAGYDPANPTAGTFALSETGPTGYTLTSLTCDNATGQVTSVTLGLGENVTCTFVNDDNAPGLTLVKEVINDNGGKAVPDDWTLTAAGYDPANPTAGTFALSETGPTGYTLTSLTCDNATGQVTSVTLGLGENVTCTFVNDDNAPGLTLVKEVINDNGGTAVPDDWTLTAAGYDPANPSAGTFALSETGPTGYTLTSLTCDNATGQVTSVTLGLGENVTCIFVNDDDAPHLTLIKEVPGDPELGEVADPSEWTLMASQNGMTVLSGEGFATGNVNAGTYALTETGGPDGYTLTSLTCDNADGQVTFVTLNLGDNVTCTFVNEIIVEPPQCETAFALGTHVFASSSKANPSGLPSLNLTDKRWGWAINLTSPTVGDTTYPIYAGAGRNNTAKGTQVGNLTINWDGWTLTVTYDIFDGYFIEEVHIYADDNPPTTIAPGQYGNTAPGTFTVHDTDEDGIWIIAHAVVCQQGDVD